MSTQHQHASNSNNLWIGELDHWMNEKYLSHALETYNIFPKNIKIIHDKTTGNSLGYGFLEFSSKDEASSTLNLLNGRQMPDSQDRIFKLNWASYSTSKSTISPNEFSIYVCELDPNVDETLLTEYFSQIYKSVIGSKIVVDPSTKISKGYGFVKFSSQEESQRAISEMNGKLINGKPMKTGVASFKKNNMNNNASNNIGDVHKRNVKVYGNTGVNVYGQESEMMFNMQNQNVNQAQQQQQQQQNLFMQQQQQYYNNYYGLNGGYYQNFMDPLYYNMYAGMYNQQQVQQAQMGMNGQTQIDMNQMQVNMNEMNNMQQTQGKADMNQQGI